MTVAGVLLAGGQSRRFGSEKAVAFWGAGLLMEPPLQALALACDMVAVSTNTARTAAAIAIACDYPVLADPDDAPAGPLAGILAALRWASGEGADFLAIVPCDAPTITPEQVRRLIAMTSATTAAAAESARGFEPLLSVWPVERGLAQVAATLQADGHPSVRSLLEQLGVACVPGFDGVNVNEPSDLPNLPAAEEEAPHATLFGFEDDFVRTLRCIPMCVRFKLDRTAIKLSLRQWSRFTLDDRQALRRAPCESVAEIECYRQLLVDLIASRAGEEARALAEIPPATWRDRTPPPAVFALAAERRVDGFLDETWRSLGDLQRYALVKLTRDKHENANFVPALIEFGVPISQAPEAARERA